MTNAVAGLIMTCFRVSFDERKFPLGRLFGESLDSGWDMAAAAAAANPRRNACPAVDSWENGNCCPAQIRC